MDSLIADLYMKPTTVELFDQYRQERSLDIHINHFSYLLSFFPALLICAADNDIDEIEWSHLEQSSATIANALQTEDFGVFSEEDIAMMIRNEMKYLSENIEKWKALFLHTLKSEIGNTVEKEFVLESIYLFANVSNEISKKEQQEIDRLITFLDLAD